MVSVPASYKKKYLGHSIEKNKWQLSLFGSKLLKYEDQDFGGISGITLSENCENFVL